jgi:hypothetical protein
MSEISSTCAVYRESTAPEWDDLVAQGYLVNKPAPPRPAKSSGAVQAYESPPAEGFDLPGDMPYIRDGKGNLVNKPAHQPHLENFFDAIRGKAKLNCDARHAFESEAPIFWVNPSALSQQPIEFSPKHLQV